MAGVPFGVRPRGTSAAAQRIDAAGRAYQRLADELEAERIRAAALKAAPLPSPRPPLLPAIYPLRVPTGVCRRIITETAAKYSVSVREILSNSRQRRLIPARHEAMYRCVAETKFSLPQIGRVFHRDHSSIGHAVMRHHMLTGAPLPRDMDWQIKNRVRQFKPPFVSLG